MKKIALHIAAVFSLTALLTIYSFAQAPNYIWAKGGGGGGCDGANSVTTDVSGNVLVTGYFQSPAIVFGTSTLTNAFSSSEDMFLVKYDASGTVLWAKCAGGSARDYPMSITTDASGNVFVAGYFQSPSIVFGSTTLTNAGGSDIFLVKYDAAGNVLWAKQGGDIGADYATSVSTDAAGNVFMAGYFQSPAIIIGSTILTNAGGNNGAPDMFLVKYNAAGTVLWAKSAGGISWDYAASAATDSSGNILVAGSFQSSSIVFGSYTLTNDTANNTPDMFLVKYDAAGTVLWAKSAGGSASDQSTSVTTDASGNIFVAGYFNSPSIIFGSTTLTLTNSSNPNFDTFIVKYNATGTVLWAQQRGGIDPNEPNSIIADPSGNILVATNKFLVKYNAAGNVLWVLNDSSVSAASVTCDVSSNFIVSGVFLTPTIIFGSTTLTNNGSCDIFTAKLGLATGIEQLNNSTAVNIYPNPFDSQTTIDFSQEQKAIILKIMDVIGKEIKTLNFTGKQLIIEKGEMPAGIYFLQIQTEQGRLSKKLIINQ